MKALKDIKTRRVNFKLTEAEYTKMCTLMEVYHYQTVSRFLRDLLAGKPLVKSRKIESISDQKFLDAMNRLTAQITIIGRNYNQAVARLEGLARRTRKDGSPVINESVVAAFVGSLKTQTEKLRDEVAVCIDMVDRMTRENKNTGYSGNDKQ